MSRKSTEELWHIASFDRAVRAHVALELLASWPIPDTDQLGFFYYASFGPPPAKEFKLYPPNWFVWIKADGTVLKPRPITPEEAGLAARQGEPFATHGWPSTWTLEEVNEKRGELLQAYDSVVPLWQQERPEANRTAVVSEFKRRFLELTPPPLLPCYRKLGQRFFHWAGI